MRMLTKVARRVPAISRLLSQRDALLRETEILRKERDKYRTSSLGAQKKIKELDALHNGAHADRNTTQWKLDDLQRKLDHIEKLKKSQRLIEVDYPYEPRVRDFANIPGGNPYERMIARHDDRYQAWLSNFASFRSEFNKIPIEKPADETEPFWNNGWFSPFDAITHYGLLATTNPKLYVEVGSGNSTKFARRAIADHGLRTQIISIDPYPRASIDKLCDEVVRSKLEDINLSRFADLNDGDVVFIDNSHRSFQGSDVTVFFTEFMPVLRPGVFWGVHDIFLPSDYPEEWTGRFYNEQYLLMTYLLGGAAGDQIEFPVAYLSQRPAFLRALGQLLEEKPWGDLSMSGGSFWMRRAGGEPSAI